MAGLGAFLRKKIARSVPISVTSLNYSNFAKMMEYKKCYKILGIPEDSDQEAIRRAYLNLVKKYHPDSGTSEADANKFSEIDRAFKILINKKSTERWNVDDETIGEHDIKHTTPQHRQYLSYGGIGVGTPFQRQKQYSKVRAVQAADNVLRHRISKVSVEEGAILTKTPTKHKIKTKYGLERLVEDLIQESISRGEFSNLSGLGKPLSSHQNINPYVDFVTHKLNEVLIDNGFTPEWITLHKEIREQIQQLRNDLLTERSYFGPHPQCLEDQDEWINIINKYENLAEQINKKIGKFNLVVPIMNKQMIQFNLQKEAQKVLISGKHSQFCAKTSSEPTRQEPSAATDVSNIFGFIESLFKK